MKKEVKKILGIIGLIELCIFLFQNVGVAIAKDPDYPTKPINFNIAFSAGGPTDLPTRALLEAASKHLGQPFIPINKPGAGGTLAIMSVVTAKPDGYTLGTISAPNAFVAPYSEDCPYKDLNGLTMIMNFGKYVLPVSVKYDAPWKTWKEFVEWARRNPKAGKIGTVGAKTVTIFGLVLGQMEKKEQVEFTYVPFKGGAEALSATLGGHVSFYASSITSLDYLTEKKLRILTYVTEEKLPGYENIPSTKELYGISAPGLLGVCSPKGLPEYVLRKLDDAFSKAANDPSFLSVMNRVLTPVVYMNRSEMKNYVEKNFLEIGEIIKMLRAEEAKEKK